MRYNDLLMKIDHENVKVIRNEKYIKPNGAEGTRPIDIGIFLMSIQETGSLNKVEGLTLESSMSGTKITSVHVGYSELIPIKEKDIIIRIERDNLKYEIKNKETYGIGTILTHNKVFMTRIDNQDD